MRLYDLEYHRKQVAKIRETLGDPASPRDLIAKPVGMRTKRYENLMLRLEKHEKETVIILNGGLKKWFDRNYT